MSRIQKVKELLDLNGVDALIIQNPVDLFYLTNKEISAGTIVVTKEVTTLFVDGRYFERCKKCKGMTVTTDEITLSGTVGFDADTTTFSTYSSLKKKASLKPIEGLGKSLRLIKEEGEIEKLRKSANLCQAGYKHILPLLKEGVTEKEIAQELMIFWLTQGAKKAAFEPIIAFGKNSAMPHYQPGSVRLKKGDTILIDIGVELDNYASDMTRTLFYEKVDEEMRHIYTTVQKAQMAALENCRPGTKICDLDASARTVIEKAGYGDNYLHSLGHGLGIEVHELPHLKKLSEESLKAGMVITIEPGIYLSNKGGVRIEDSVVITPNGYENLIAIPKEITQC